MITRRDFLARGLRNSTLIALAPTLPGFLARTARAAGAREGRPRPGRRPARRRQRRHQHGRPVRGRRLRQAPQGAPPAREAADQGQRRGRAAPGDGRRGQAAGIGPAGDRAGRRLSQPEPVAFPQHGDLAVGPPRRARAHRAGLDRPRARRRPADPRRRRRPRSWSDRRPAAGHPRPAVRQRRARPARRLCLDRRRGPKPSGPRPVRRPGGSSSAAACWTPTPPPTDWQPSPGPGRPHAYPASRTGPAASWRPG